MAEGIERLIREGTIQSGDRLPPTRQLASQLGLNRTTVAAAYSTLEKAGLIRGHIGRGSFVAGQPAPSSRNTTSGNASRDESTRPPEYPVSRNPMPPQPAANIEISFASSRPSSDTFPLQAFRRVAKEAIESPDAAEILQLGSAHGFQPLRRFLLESARDSGIAGPADDLLITNGCQQALDLLARIFIGHKTPVAVEDPVYHGLIRVFERAGAELIPVPVDADGMNIAALETVLERQHPKMLVITPSFQNPTGATLSLAKRRRVVELARRHGVLLVENDIYSELRYHGEALPALKALDEGGGTILLRSYSKILFPGLRVGWVIGPRAIIAQLAEAKQISDLHSDQLSQAVLLRFTESGELQKHFEKTLAAGAERLAAALDACREFLPPGATFTRPEGGMNLWVELPAPLTAARLLTEAQQHGVDFLPGIYFSPRGDHARGLRISFGGLAPDEIRRGLKILGECAARELGENPTLAAYEAAAVLV